MTHLTTGFLPSPSANGFHIGPLFIHAYGLAYVVAVTAAVTRSPPPLGGAGGDRLVYDVALWGFPAGIIGGRLYFIDQLERGARHTGGAVAIWEGGSGIWGGIAPARRRDLAAAAPGANIRCSWTPARRGCSSRRRSGGSATTSTRSSSAARRRSLGAQISPAHARPATCSTRPSSRRSSTSSSGICVRAASGVAGRTAADPAARPVRALRGRLRGFRVS